MIKEMNKEIFSHHLDMTIEELKIKAGINLSDYAFIINPVTEKGKPLNGKDEVMRLNIINKDRVNNKLFSKEEVISMLTFFKPFVPIWIDVEHIPTYKDKLVFQLNCSVRLRKPSLLRNQESGHPPFKAII